jgi:hypothetical protein
MRSSQPLWLEFTLIQGEAEVVKKGERAKIPLSTPHPPFSSLESNESRESFLRPFICFFPGKIVVLSRQPPR